MQSEIEEALRKARILHSLLADEKPGWVNFTQDIQDLLTQVLDELPPEIRSSSSRYQNKFNYETQPNDMALVTWKQPRKRFAPVWSHVVTCPYCNVTTTIEHHSATPPKHCGQPDCEAAHQRLLARERKRRQRVRQRQKNKKSRSNNIS